MTSYREAEYTKYDQRVIGQSKERNQLQTYLESSRKFFKRALYQEDEEKVSILTD